MPDLIASVEEREVGDVTARFTMLVCEHYTRQGQISTPNTPDAVALRLATIGAMVRTRCACLEAYLASIS